jgi:uncharacterized protein (TIRG00374 family)
MLLYNVSMSFRAWASILTIILLGLIIYFTRSEVVHAWELLGKVNLWVLALLIPLQFVTYFAAGEMMFSYLRQKRLIRHISPLQQARMALEMNFVNHALPSGGVSGISYMSWRLSKLQVTASKATIAQLVRYVAGFASFIVLLLISMAIITIDGEINRFIVLFGGLIMVAMLIGTFLLLVLISSKRRSELFGNSVARLLNRAISFVTFRRKTKVIQSSVIADFFIEMHDEYLILRKEPKILIKPFLWGLLFNLLDAALFFITFLAFGVFVNPAIILIAYGLASLAGALVVTPGGAGAYETIMVSFISGAGVTAGVVIAAVVVTRVIVLMGTIGFGYVFYQLALLKYGKPKS